MNDICLLPIFLSPVTTDIPRPTKMAMTKQRSVRIQVEPDNEFPIHEGNHLLVDEEDDDMDDLMALKEFSHLQPALRQEALAAERLSIRLLSIPDHDEASADRVVRQSLRLLSFMADEEEEGAEEEALEIESPREKELRRVAARRRFWTMISLSVLFVSLMIVGTTYFLSKYLHLRIGQPPNQPVGPYQLVERQEGTEFFQYYTFYEGVSLHHAIYVDALLHVISVSTIDNPARLSWIEWIRLLR
jgi:hypothetical protein